MARQKEGMRPREPGGQPDSDDDRCSDRGVSNPPLNVDVCSRQFSELILLSGNDEFQPLSFVAELDVINFECQPCGFFLRQSTRCLLQFSPDPLQLVLSAAIILLRLLQLGLARLVVGLAPSKREPRVVSVSFRLSARLLGFT